MQKTLSTLVLVSLLVLKCEAQWNFHDDLGGVPMSSAPGSVLLSDNSVRVFYRGSNHHLWQNTGPNNNSVWWSAPADLGGVELTSAPSAVTLSGVDLYVFYRGPNQNLWMSSWPDRGGVFWGPAQDFGIAMNSAPSAVVANNGAILIFYQGSNNHLWLVTYFNHIVNRPSDLGVSNMASSPSASVQPKLSNVIQNALVCYRGTNNHCWLVSQRNRYLPEEIGTVNIQGAPALLTNKSNQLEVFYRGLDNHLWRLPGPGIESPNSWSSPIDLSGNLSSEPVALYNTVFYRGVNQDLWETSFAPYDIIATNNDQNGLPLNPGWKSTFLPPHFAAPSADNCGGDPWLFPCTTQKPIINNNKGLCLAGGGNLYGHANYGLSTFNGEVLWVSHSLESQDDDYNFNMFTAFNRGITANDNQGLHIEFSSNETIDHFHTSWWSSFHSAVDDDDSRSIINAFGEPRRVLVRGSNTAAKMVNGASAIVIGELGLDCAHSCGAEIHPALGFAMQVKTDPNDATWVFFAKNWGNEGYCGSNTLEYGITSFTFSIPYCAGATGVNIVSSEFLSRSSVATVNFEDIPSSHKFLVTLTVDKASAHDRINGEIHFQWTGNPQCANLFDAKAIKLKRFFVDKTHPDAETLQARRFSKLSETEKKAYLKSLPPKNTEMDRQHLQLTRVIAQKHFEETPRQKVDHIMVPDKEKIKSDSLRMRLFNKKVLVGSHHQ